MKEPVRKKAEARVERKAREAGAVRAADQAIFCWPVRLRKGRRASNQ